MKYTFIHEKYRNRALVAIMLFAGLRMWEVLNLKLNDIDFEENTIFIKSWKWNKDRIVPLNAELKTILTDYLKDRSRLNKTTIYFFTAVQKDNQLNNKSLERAFCRIKKYSWVNFSAHKLRHTFATLMLEWWCDLFSLSKMMWHSNIKTTTIYLNATVHHLQGQIGKHPLSI